MKKQILILYLIILSNFLNAQSIIPSFNNEYCPETEYIFTVSIPGTYTSIIGIGGAYITQAPFNFGTALGSTTFDFKGVFADANQAQKFHIKYDNNSATFEPTFKKIKSLYYGTTCTPIQPNVSQITVPRCQIVNTTISFNNIPWSTAFESPVICFGSIANYEYQLPAGWSIGSNVSTGSNWIAVLADFRRSLEKV